MKKNNLNLKIQSLSSFNDQKEGGYILSGSHGNIIFKNKIGSTDSIICIESENTNIEIQIPKDIVEATLKSFFSQGYSFDIDKYTGI